MRNRIFASATVSARIQKITVRYQKMSPRLRSVSQSPQERELELIGKTLAATAEELITLFKSKLDNPLCDLRKPDAVTVMKQWIDTADAVQRMTYRYNRLSKKTLETTPLWIWKSTAEFLLDTRGASVIECDTPSGLS